MKDLLVFFADGFEEVEALTVVDYLRRADIGVTTVSIYDRKEVEGAHGVKVITDKAFNEVDFKEFKGIYIPGGLPGAEYIRDKEEVVELIKEFNKENKLVSAICAGPTVLDKAGVLTENEFTCYPGYEGNLSTKGRQDKDVVAKDNVITAMGPALAMNMAFELIEYFKGKEVLENIKKDVLFPQLVESIK